MQEELNSACEAPTLKRVIRLDSVPVKKADFTEEGYLVDHPILTTTGIFEYTNPDGSTRRELRLPSEVFDEESLKSYKGKPIVITHDAGLITKENVGKEQIGTILSDGYRDQDSVRAEIVIHDTDEMKESGLKELSLGYNLELDETPGVWNGQKYDAVQRNIRINHLALVREARAGDNARLNIDSRDGNVLKGGIVMTASKKRKHTARADGILSEEELAKAIEEYKKRHPKTDAKEPDEDVEEEVVETVEEDSHDDKIPSFAKGDLTSKINKCLLNRDKRDDEGDPDPDDPDHYNKLMNTIARQDEDLQTLFDIIDTLLAEKDFGSEKKEDAKDKAPDDDEELLLEEEDIEEDGDDKDEDAIEVDPSGKELDGDDDDVDIDIDIPDNDDDEENEDACKSDEDDDDDFVDEENEDACKSDEDDEDVDIDIDIPDDDDDDEENEDACKSDECDDDDDDDEDDEDVEIEIDGDDEDEEEEVEIEDLFKKHKGVNADSVDAIVRTRVKIGMVGRSLNMDGLENKDIREAMRSIIRKVRPTMRLDGKSDTYIKAAFDMACDEVKANEKAPKGVDYQRRQMYNKKTVRNDSSEKGGAEAARQRMIKNMNIKKEGK